LAAGLSQDLRRSLKALQQNPYTWAGEDVEIKEDGNEEAGKE